MTVVPSGHSVGKSRLAALPILWWLFTRRGSLVLVTAPSANLIGSVVFKEFRKAKNCGFAVTDFVLCF